MIRNMEKVVSETRGKIPRGYNLSCDECIRLVKMAVEGGGDSNGAFEAICTAFNYGFALGKRCEKRQKKTPAKKQG